ncbi:MAG: hypothetical protein PHF46_02885 [Candidatus Gracilibacteria bacterium]|nr:hypothetical protein [Candidatus Gracilibacteria bacterium]MDD3120329.1 hypothetical protein [Candidatus Gracilibacteria bacterium]MDD4530609.1 hypothetical protein [Candidatus Gracilibacteria bacterium]
MLLLSTSTLKGYGLHKIFKICKESGYDGLNLDLSKQDFDTQNAEYIKELSDFFGVNVVSITSYERKMSNNVVDEIIKMAGILGTKIINFYPPLRTDGDGNWFNEYLPIIKKKNPDLIISIISVEPKTFLFFIPEYKDATLTAIKKITGETTLNISSVDPASGFDLMKTFSVLGNSIHNIFLSDKTGTKGEMLLGYGEMPLESFLIKLKQSGYDRSFTLKVNAKDILAGDDEGLFKKLEESKKFLYSYFK